MTLDKIGKVGLLMPGLLRTISNEMKGDPYVIRDELDKIVLCLDGHSVPITFEQICVAFDGDMYDTLTNAAKNAALYLRAIKYGNARKYRAFRSKRRSILARKHRQ